MHSTKQIIFTVRRLSVYHVGGICIHMTEDIVKLLSRLGSPVVLVFWPQRRYPIPGGCKIHGVEKFRGLSRKRYDIGPWLLLVPGVSHVKKCDWLVKNMTDWRLAVNMTGGSDLHQLCCLLLCLLCSARHRQWSYSSYYM